MADTGAGGKVALMTAATLWTGFTTLVASVPPVIWGALIASGITFFGVILSNQHTLKRLRIQLDAEAARKREERASDLRKDVLLTLANEITKFGWSLCRLATSDQEEFKKVSAGDERMSAFAKARVVAEPSTVLLIDRLGHLYSILHNDVIAKLAPLHKANIDAGHAQVQFDELVTAMTPMQEQLLSIVPGPPLTPEQAHLHTRFQEATSVLAKHRDVILSKKQEAMAELVLLNKFIFEELSKLVELTDRLSSRIREDLGFSGNLPGLKEQGEEQRKSLAIQMERLMKMIPENYMEAKKTVSH